MQCSKVYGVRRFAAEIEVADRRSKHLRVVAPALAGQSEISETAPKSKSKKNDKLPHGWLGKHLS